MESDKEKELKKLKKRQEKSKNMMNEINNGKIPEVDNSMSTNNVTVVDPSKIAKNIINSIIKEVPFLSKNKQLMLKKKETLEKVKNEHKLVEYCKNNG